MQSQDSCMHVRFGYRVCFLPGWAAVAWHLVGGWPFLCIESALLAEPYPTMLSSGQCQTVHSADQLVQHKSCMQHAICSLNKALPSGFACKQSNLIHARAARTKSSKSKNSRAEQSKEESSTAEHCCTACLARIQRVVLIIQCQVHVVTVLCHAVCLCWSCHMSQHADFLDKRAVQNCRLHVSTAGCCKNRAKQWLRRAALITTPKDRSTAQQCTGK